MSGFQLAGRRWWLRGYLAGRSTSAVESSGLNWMTKLSWTAIGIRPGVHSSRATDPRHIAIKLQASREDTMSREVLTSPLNQRRFSVAIFVAIPSTARSGSQWFWVDIENTHWNQLTSTAPSHSTTIG